jgi:excisionase family DNA binding protein
MCSRDSTTLRLAGLSLGVYYGVVGQERESRDSRQDSLQDRPQDVLLDRITVAEAARRLGVTQDAVRKRIARGTIRHQKDEDGRVFVYLRAADTELGTAKTDQDNEQDSTSTTDQDKYVRSLEDQMRFLRGELERKDAILLRLAERIPELEPYSEPRELSETHSEEPEDAQRRPAKEKAQGHPRARTRRWVTVLAILFVLVAAAVLFYAFAVLSPFSLP